MMNSVTLTSSAVIMNYLILLCVMINNLNHVDCHNANDTEWVVSQYN